MSNLRQQPPSKAVVTPDISPTNSSGTTGVSQKSNEPLPLGWTQIKRQEDESGKSSAALSSAEELCCDDPSCGLTVSQRAERDKSLQDIAGRRLVRGKAVFLLHEEDPSWIQGYFFPTSESRSWGILAVQQDVDECLRCSEGGYRVVNVSVNAFDGNPAHDFPAIEWLGGDMMVWKHPLVQFEAEKIVTGLAASETCERVFASLVKKLRGAANGESKSEARLLELLPGLAVVHGSMRIRVPLVEDDLWD